MRPEQNNLINTIHTQCTKIWYNRYIVKQSIVTTKICHDCFSEASFR